RSTKDSKTLSRPTARRSPSSSREMRGFSSSGSRSRSRSSMQPSLVWSCPPCLVTMPITSLSTLLARITSSSSSSSPNPRTTA
ncbi:hypothetical protein EV182_003165, partial [Spiromyces aspiralis]